MAMVANDPAAAKRTGIPQSVGKEFVQADKGLKLKGSAEQRPDRQVVNRSETSHGKSGLFKQGGLMATKKMASGGSVDAGNSTKMQKVKTAAPSRDGVASKGKTKGKQVSMPGNKGMKKGGKC
jgi:hypothetical protein